ncbi:MAG: ribosome biogenesis factor YjgA [Burkholderiaceae bacterium]
MPAPRRHHRDTSGDPAPPTGAIDAAERPSKTRRKRDAHALQALGERLTTLRDDVLVRLPVGETLIDAVRTARDLRSHEARRRQLQLIGKLMREADGEAIRAALDDEGHEHRAAVAIQHAAERWRERMLADERVLANWYAEFPDTRAAIETLVAAVRAEQAAGVPGRSFRQLYRKLHATLTAAADGAANQFDAGEADRGSPPDRSLR